MTELVYFRVSEFVDLCFYVLVHIFSCSFIYFNVLKA